MHLKILGKTTTLHISSICRSHYKCEPAEYEVSKNFAAEQSVNILHRRAIDGAVTINIAANNMSVEAAFLPPINGGKVLSLEEAMNLAFSPGGVSRIFADINAFKSAYETMLDGNIVDGVVIAVGKQPVHGKDAKVQIFFEIPSDEPVKSASGNANYKQQRRFVNVRTEQILARVTPATEGEPGLTVNSNHIPQVKGKPPNLSAGKGVKVSENGTQFNADIDGYIEYKNGVLSVQPTVFVSGDVDLSVGDIDFVGAVEVSGDILSGFTVKGKDVHLGGICQDATIIADNNVTVRGGIKGRNNLGNITAGGNIDIAYCEMGTLNAKGSITIHKYAFNSVINAGDSVKADSRSTIAGGKITSFSGGSFYNLGTKANTNIEIIIGKKYDTDEKLSRINDEIKRLTDTLNKINENISAVDIKNPQIVKHPKFIKLIETRDLITKRLNLFEKRINTITKESVHSFPSIEVANEVQEGTTLRFFETLHKVRSTLRRVRFTFEPASQSVECHNI